MNREPLGTNKGQRAHTNQKHQAYGRTALRSSASLPTNANGGKTNSQRLGDSILPAATPSEFATRYATGSAKALGRLALHLAKQHAGTGARAGNKSADHAESKEATSEENAPATPMQNEEMEEIMPE